MIRAAIIGAQGAMLVMGFYLLITGKTSHNKDAKYIVHGWPVRLLGVILLLPYPLAFLVGFGIAFWATIQGKDASALLTPWVGMAIDASMIVLCFLAFRIVSFVYQVPLKGSKEGITQT